MPNSLLTGVSGLLAHQRMLDIVGHNIANVNTTGFKSQRSVFADLMYEVVRPASAASEGDKGGTNPLQIGLGVKLAQTDRKFSQGSLENTGEQFDMAISGGGFFVVTDGVSDFYTRAGSFALDEKGMLVAPGGMRVKRFPGPGEASGSAPGFQIPGDDNIRVPLGTAVPGSPTSQVTLTGNLNAELTPPVNEIMQSPVAFTDGTGAPATAATLLNDLQSNVVDYQSPDAIVMDGINADGTTVPQFTVAVDQNSTMQTLIDAINNNFVGFTASLNAGNLVLTADNPGPTNFSVQFRDQVGNTGITSLTNHVPVTIVTGKLADTYSEMITVVDPRGGTHEVGLTFEKLTDDEWRMTADMALTDGTIIDDTIDNIVFNDDGSLRSTGDATLTFSFAGIGAPQDVQFSFDDNSGLERLTHLETDGFLRRTQDGAEAGVLNSVSVQRDGRLMGIASNGRIFTIAQLAIASFRNPKGLVANGDSLYLTSLNSGEPEIGLAGSGERGEVFAGQLESSNVDMAFEFTRLIVAQRGFAANARTITVSDEMLEELTNIIR